MKAAFLAVVLVSGCAGFRNYRDDGKAAEAPMFSAADILADARENAVRVDLEHNDRIERFTGTIVDIGITTIRTRDAHSVCSSIYSTTICNSYPASTEKRSFVAFAGPLEQPGAVFVCLFRNTNYGDVAALTKGETVTIAGRISTIARNDSGDTIITAIRCMLPGDH